MPAFAGMTPWNGIEPLEPERQRHLGAAPAAAQRDGAAAGRAAGFPLFS